MTRCALQYSVLYRFAVIRYGTAVHLTRRVPDIRQLCYCGDCTYWNCANIVYGFADADKSAADVVEKIAAKWFSASAKV